MNSFRWTVVIAVLFVPQIGGAEDIDPRVMDEKISNLYQLSFVPIETSIEAIPVSSIDPSWLKVLVLRKEVLPKWAQEYIARDKYRNKRNPWQVTEDLDGDGSAEKVLVGVYLNRSGEIGRFLLVLKKQNNEKWAKAFLELDHGHSSQYSEIHWDVKKRRLTWGVCYPCDFVIWVHWDGKKYITSSPKFE